MNKITYLAGTATLSAMMAMFCGSEAHAQAKLQKQGTATQITVGGKPMLLLCGELSNSAATCEADIISVMRTCKERGLNTVLVPHNGTSSNRMKASLTSRCRKLS